MSTSKSIISDPLDLNVRFCCQTSLVDDFRLQFQTFYQNKQFFDFEIKVGDNEEPIRCHKWFLILNGFEAVKKCVGNGLTIEDIEDKNLVESVIHFYYSQDFNFEFKDIKGLISIAEQLENPKLLTLLKTNVLSSKRKFDTMCMKALEDIDSSTNKRLKPSDLSSGLHSESPVHKFIPIGRPKESEDKPLDDSIESNRFNESNGNVTIDENADNNVNKNIEQKIVAKMKTITTQCIGFIPSDDSGDTLIIDEQNDKTLENNELSLRTNDKTVGSLSGHQNKGQRESSFNPKSILDFHNSVIQTVYGQSAERSKLVLSKARANGPKLALKTKTLRSRSSLTESNDKTNPFPDNDLKKYKFERMFAQNSIKSSTQVWKSCFVPPIKTEYEGLVAVVGGPHVNWFDLKNEIHSKPEPIHVFESPEQKDLRSMAVTVVSDSVIYAIGSDGCLFVLKHPIQKKVKNDNKIEGFISKEETVMDVTFNIISDVIYLFCGTSDMKVFIFKLLLDELLKKDNCCPQFTYNCNFIVSSIIYVHKYDSLVVCGESSDVIVLKDISKTEKLIVGKITPNRNLGSISSVVYIPEVDVIGFRYLKTEYIQMGVMDKMMSKFDPLKPNYNKAITLTFISSAKLQHKNCQNGSEPMEYIYMSHNCRQIYCGDDSGNIFVYAVNDSLKEKGLSIQPIQVISIPLNNKPPNKLPLIIRSVSISDDSKYLVGTTNQNIIITYN